MGPTGNGVRSSAVRNRAGEIYRGVTTVLGRTKTSFSDMVGAAYFLGGVSSFNTFGRVCNRCFSSGPTHSYININSLPGATLIRIRVVTGMWSNFMGPRFYCFHFGERIMVQLDICVTLT